jgi:putative ABC transport system permease protein
LLTGIIFGLVPALQSSRLDLNEVLKEGGRHSSMGAGQRLRSALVVGEIAMAVVLLVGAGLMMKSLLRLLQTNVGFNTENLLTMGIVLSPPKYTDANQVTNFYTQLNESVRALPGVVSAGTVDILPLNAGNTTRVYVDGDPIPAPGKEMEANIRVVNEHYFQTIGVPLLAGRTFDERDAAGAPTVVIIGKTIADRLFPGRDPVGRRFRYPSIQVDPITIVGVVGDVKITGLDEEIKPVLYYPARQGGLNANLVVRTNIDPTSLTNAVRAEVNKLDPDAAILNVNTMEGMIAQTPASFIRRFPALLIGIFAGVALLLASIGIYGVVSYSVTQQIHYIGIRMALGARPADILRMVLKQGMILALAGIAIGVVAAVALMKLLTTQVATTLLYQVKITDITTFAIVSGTLFVVALLACYLPARRATKVDPLVALRYE